MSFLLTLFLLILGILLYGLISMAVRIYLAVRKARKAMGIGPDDTGPDDTGRSESGRESRNESRNESGSESRRGWRQTWRQTWRQGYPKPRSRRKIPKEYAIDAEFTELPLTGEESFLEVYSENFRFAQEQQISEAEYTVIK